ncbi:energy transducer TonB [Microvirga sp. STR05]|uniref:Energy transducer TonB n=1 Tax=Hymenobacter duratus TaxID=2771356 RepID=A0ABR8JPB6_9BACT|nr:energy transducer TonB [Hymenobacter duratus]MBD2716639.1 energy transducer TonB [Hymenobacter duratus]MBR7951554.1 energy transducer TonB [Microvirga sp. STR05]
MKKVLPALLIGIAYVAGCPEAGWAQSATYNRWDARPAAPIKPKPLSVPPLALRLQRGIGQRLANQRRLPADSLFFRYVWGKIRYPAAALRAGLEGQVSVRLTIAADGAVTGAQGAGNKLRQVVANVTPQARAAGEDQMVEEACRVLRGLLFEPAATSTEEVIRVSYLIR